MGRGRGVGEVGRRGVDKFRRRDVDEFRRRDVWHRVTELWVVKDTVC